MTFAARDREAWEVERKRGSRLRVDSSLKQHSTAQHQHLFIILLPLLRRHAS